MIFSAKELSSPVPLTGWFVTVLSLLLMSICGCRRDHLPALSTGGQDYLQVNLVADTTVFGASRIDANLGNPCGIAISPKGRIWISCSRTGQSVIYDSNGVQLFSPVAVLLNSTHNASPDGMVYNTTSDFIVNGNPAKCIYATEEGIVSAWNSGDSTTTVADRSAGNALYKGVAIANDGTGNFIYAADFFNGKIDVYDKSFNYITGKPFLDPNIPAGFAPYNICNIGGKLYVTYAKQKSPAGYYNETGPGNGYIDVFNPDGILVKRFASKGVLNCPWGITEAPIAFGQGANTLLVANNGDGKINVFDTSGAYIGPLENNGTPIIIEGLWDIVFNPTNNSQLYFTAGPHDETYGLFGYLKVK